MKKRILSMLFVLSAFIVPASVQAQWVVSDPGNLVQGIVNSVNEIVETSETAQNALSTWKETSKIFEQGRQAAQSERPDQRQRESQGVRPDAR